MRTRHINLGWFDIETLQAASNQAEISSLVWTRANCDRMEQAGLLACVDRDARLGLDCIVCKYEITPEGRKRLAREQEAG